MLLLALFSYVNTKWHIFIVFFQLVALFVNERGKIWQQKTSFTKSNIGLITNWTLRTFFSCKTADFCHEKTKNKDKTGNRNERADMTYRTQSWG